ncbi:MAG: hypothetical protein A4E55_01835 [Pelotomaculum sp. PtaU1.Bin035]|nr:MAG: hypothetical protein A4E55_01835 [Pelotomaculum sp. PtaU1.Bin035]
MEQVLTYAINSKEVGIFAILFIALLGWVLRTNYQREERYLNIVDKYGDKIEEKVTDIDGRVCNLEEDVKEIKADVKTIMVSK